MDPKGTLYVVGTPIGNLDDITVRAIQTLKTVSRIVSEKPATTKKLLNRYEIVTPLSAYHEHLCGSNWERVIVWIEKGDSIALVSEAGMPCIEDPGVELVNQCRNKNIPVVVIPGPSALITALISSGFPNSTFTFYGFLPKKQTERMRILQTIRDSANAAILYESPHRLMNSLKEMTTVINNRQIAVCREMTKFYEEVLRGTPEEIIKRFQTSPLKGEATIVVSSGTAAKQPDLLNDQEISKKISGLIRKGLSRSEAAKEVATQLGIPKKKAYVLAHI